VKKKSIPSGASAVKQEAIVFKTNIIVPRVLDDHLGGFIAAGSPSPYFSLEEVPESLRAFVGQPDPPPFDQASWDAETEAIKNSFSPTLNESIEEELLQRQNQALSDAKARNEIETEKAARQDEFERELLAEHDRDVETLYPRDKKKSHQ
jgi:hypothetical protein